MQNADEPLGRGNEVYYASKVADGTISCVDARRLLSEFVRQASVGTVSPEMIEHLRVCISAFLAGKKTLMPAPKTERDTPVAVPIQTLEKAFGLTRVSSGQPPIDADTLTAVAADLLRKRLAGESHQDALSSIAAERKQRGWSVSSETEIGEAWAGHKLEALDYLRVFRISGLDPSGDTWTPEERRRLTKIYAKVEGAVLPGARPKRRTGESGR